MVYKCFDKKSKGSGVDMPLEFNEQLAEDLHKPIFRNLKKEQFILDLKIIFGYSFRESLLQPLTI